MVEKRRVKSSYSETLAQPHPQQMFYLRQSAQVLSGFSGSSNLTHSWGLWFKDHPPSLCVLPDYPLGVRGKWEKK